METTNHLILLEQFCSCHHVETSFVVALQEYGLISIIVQEHQQYIEEDNLAKLEKMIRFHYEMDINIEGIEAITHLLDKVEQLQQHIHTLQQQQIT